MIDPDGSHLSRFILGLPTKLEAGGNCVIVPSSFLYREPAIALAINGTASNQPGSFRPSAIQALRRGIRRWVPASNR
jgi:hypothetical protein